MLGDLNMENDALSTDNVGFSFRFSEKKYGFKTPAPPLGLFFLGFKFFF